MGGMESGPSGFESTSRGAEKNFEHLHHQESSRSLEDTHRDLGRVALEGAGIDEPSESSVSSEVYQSLGQTAVKNY